MADTFKITGHARFKGGRAAKSFTAFDGREKYLGKGLQVDVGGHAHSRVRIYEDFLAVSGTTLPAPWGKQDTSAGGSPTTDYVDDAANGVYQLLTDSTSEAQNLTLYWADQLMIDPTKAPVMTCRFKVDADAIPWTADQRLVVGLASARDATLDDVVSNAWFRVEGASANLLFEADDGTTDTDDQDSGVDIADDTWITVRIDMHDLSAVKFLVDSEDGNGFVLKGTADVSALTASNVLQPFIEMQRDAGTETEDLRVDYVEITWSRY